jgi:hypothetical protein
MGSVNTNLERCPFRWQYPVSSPTTHLSWSLFNFNRSLVLRAEGPDTSPFTCLSLVTDSQYFLWFLLVQSLAAFLATPIDMSQALGSIRCWEISWIAERLAVYQGGVTQWRPRYITHMRMVKGRLLFLHSFPYRYRLFIELGRLW